MSNMVLSFNNEQNKNLFAPSIKEVKVLKVEYTYLQIPKK